MSRFTCVGIAAVAVLLSAGALIDGPGQPQIRSRTTASPAAG